MDLFVYVLESHQLATTVKTHIKVSFSKCIQIKKKKVSDKINIKQIVGLGADRGMGDEMADTATHVQGHQ